MTKVCATCGLVCCRHVEGVVDTLRTDLELARSALREIAEMEAVQRNPDGVDQAAATAILIANEALDALKTWSPEVAEALHWLADELRRDH